MMKNGRRSFMKRSAALVSGLAVSSCAPTAETPAPTRTGLEPSTLRALGRVVLPEKALGETGIERVLDGFRKWVDELEPVAELDHAYIFTDDILYGPPHPAALWNAQLEALELEAEKRHGIAFDELSLEEKEALVKRQLPKDVGERLPDPASAPHVALGLLAYFYQTSEATDLCYERSIEPYTCRGLDSVASEPSPRRS
jgi:hypothetical protein